MKKLAYLLIPIIIVGFIVYALFTFFIFSDNGKGALQITSKPFSKVYLNGSYIGTTPLCRCEAHTMIASGTYTLKLVPLEKGLPEYEEQVKINKGVLSVVDRKIDTGVYSEGSVITLDTLPDKNAAELLVITFPDKADVFIDANPEGTSPLHRTELTDSDHTIRIKKNGYKDKTVRIRTPSGYKLTARVYLSILKDDEQILPIPTQAVTPSITPVPTGKQQISIRILETPNGFLRVREQASTDALEIGRVSTGETFQVLEEQKGWYKISLQNGTIGWISGQYVTKLTTND